MLDGLNTYFDSREIPTDHVVECDLCIIGGGAAGITLAKEFADTNVKVCLLESGGFSFEDSTNELNDVEIVGHNYSGNGSRLRYFGGSTNHWGGHCAPIRPIVFKKREWIPYSGWPFGIEELHPYYERAHEIIGLGPYNYDPVDIAERLGYKLFPFDFKKVETQLSRYHPQRFGEQFRQPLEEARNVSVFLYATVTSINLDTNKRRVTDVTVNTLAKNNFTVKSKNTVLATGGIENARILLLCNKDMPNGLGNEHDVVGRFFLEHIAFNRGFILPIDQDKDKVSLYGTENLLDAAYAARCHLIISEEQVRELEIPEYRVELQISHTRNYFESVRSSNRLKRAMKSKEFGDISVKDILSIIKDPLKPLANKFDKDGAPLVYGFLNNVEQVPNPESRVILNDQKDALGQNRVSLNWQLSNIDREGIVRAQQLIAQEVGRTGIGRMNVYVPDDDEERILETANGGAHHMGTTRMHTDPKQGVVDSNSRIHGLENIYIAGSSIFPTAGYPNPTLTITALTIRLADHLKHKLANPNENIS